MILAVVLSFVCPLISLPTGLIMPYYALSCLIMPYYALLCLIMPYICLMSLSSSSSSCCFVGATAANFSVLFCPCNSSYLFLLQARMLFLQPFRSNLLAFTFFRTLAVCFVLSCIVSFCIVLFCFVLSCFVLYCIVLYCFVLLCIALFCFVLFFSVSYGLACFRCVLVPGTLALHLLYLDDLHLFGFTLVSVCNHIICLSLG